MLAYIVLPYARPYGKKVQGHLMTYVFLRPTLEGIPCPMDISCWILFCVFFLWKSCNVHSGSTHLYSHFKHIFFQWQSMAIIRVRWYAWFRRTSLGCQPLSSCCLDHCVPQSYQRHQIIGKGEFLIIWISRLFLIYYVALKVHKEAFWLQKI